MNLLSLPLDLLVKIMLKLPGVRYLLHFTCVSRFCRNFVSQPDFAKLHFKESSTPIHRVIIQKSALPQILFSIDLDKSLLDDSACAHIETPFLTPQILPPGARYFKSITSCRGLVLLVDEFALYQFPCLDMDNLSPPIYLWNPSTGVHREIPLPRSASLFVDPPLYGFWYDQPRDDYVIILSVSDSKGIDKTQFLFFSLKANSWQNLEVTDYFNSGKKPRVGSLLNGSIHWFVGRQEDVPPSKRNYILAFDFTRRTFFEIDLPDNVVFDINICSCDLWIHKGLLSLWILGDESTEIWTMDNYRVHSSWTKSTIVPSEDSGGEFIPICSYGGNTIGWDGHQGLVKCNEAGVVLESRMYWDDSEEEEKEAKEDLAKIMMWAEAFFAKYEAELVEEEEAEVEAEAEAETEAEVEVEVEVEVETEAEAEAEANNVISEGIYMMGAGMYVESLLSLPEVNAN